MPRFEDVAVGQEIPTETRTVVQADLVRYAGASGDLNPLHWDPDFARTVSPTKGIIAHGMLNMGHLSRVVATWAGGPERLRELEVSFRAPCPVGATIHIGGEVTALDAGERTATLAVWVELDSGERVVDRRRSRATVRLD